MGNVYSLSHMEGGGGGREGDSDPNKSSSSGKWDALDRARKGYGVASLVPTSWGIASTLLSPAPPPNLCPRRN